MNTIQVPTRDQVSPANQALFDQLKKGLGMVPNLYATLALSEHALGNYWLSRQATHLHWRRPGGSTRHRDTENVVGFLTSTPKANRRSSLPAGRARIELALTPHTVRPRACSTGVVGRLIAQTPPSHAQAEPKVSKRMLEIDRRLRSDFG